MNKTRKLTTLAMFLAVSIVLSIFENFIPLNFGVPGVKLGLANVISLLALYYYGFKEAYVIMFIRVMLVSFMFGGINSSFYAFLGGTFAVIIMFIVFKVLKEKVSCIGISVAGSIGHNIGQVTAAVIILNSVRIYSYLTFLLLASILTGILTGSVSNYIVKIYRKH